MYFYLYYWCVRRNSWLSVQHPDMVDFSAAVAYAQTLASQSGREIAVMNDSGQRVY